jgi:lysophospholipase L1-like esterase
MVGRIARPRTTRRAGIFGAALVSALLTALPAPAQNASPTAGATPLSKLCQPGVSALGANGPLPNVATALAKRKALRILAFGAAPGRVSTRAGGYTALIEAMLQNTLKGIAVTMINRGVSGALAANAAARMKNEVALEEPDLVLWQVGTNDALAYVPADEFALTVKAQIDWLKAHNVDVVLVGLQFASQMQRDAHYVEIREALRRVGAQENVLVIRFFEAMRIVNQAAEEGLGAVAGDVAREEVDYNCLAQYVARAITLGVFAKDLPKRPAPAQ